MKSKFIAYIVLLTLTVSVNVYYHWDKFWTIWAKQYVKDQDVVISLTTIPSRITELKSTLECLSQQNLQPRQIFLNIPHKFKRKNEDYIIPNWLYTYPNLTILRTEDYGPATKLLGTLQQADLTDDTIIITVDDDTCYPSNLILRLTVRAKQYPQHAIGVSGVELNFAPDYPDGVSRVRLDQQYVSILEGFAGVAYRRYFFDSSVLKIIDEPNCCYNSDDLYLSFHLAKNNIPRHTLYNKFLSVRHIRQSNFGFGDDALYKLEQANRYATCIDHLQNKYPQTVFINSHSVNQ